MERFTNDVGQFINQLKLELNTFNTEENSTSIFTYIEIPSFLIYGFSYNLIKKDNSNEYLLKCKEWDAKYDHARFDKGIFNLDRLAIKETKTPIKTLNKFSFESTDWNALDIIKSEKIVLDGLMCNLKILENKKNLNWNIDEEMNLPLSKLISSIRNLKRKFSPKN